MDWLALFISSTGFTGFIPGKIISRPGVGGGLVGSIVGLVLQMCVLTHGAESGIIWWMILLSFVLGVIFVWPAEQFMLQKWGERMRHTGEIVDHDFNQTNIDEVLGQLIAGLPVFALDGVVINKQIGLLILSFVLFRVLDTLKLWPIKKAETVFNGSYAVMMDDVVAGIMAAMIILVIGKCII